MNFLTLTGNLGKPAELRSLQDGTQVLNFSVADSQGKDKPTLWWECSFFGKRAQSISQYMGKGQQVTVVGQLTEREYTAKDGTTKKAFSVRVTDVALQGGRQDGGGNQQEDTPVTAARPVQAARPAAAPAPIDDDFDIPF